MKKSWHQLPVQEAIGHLRSGLKGLSDEEAKRRLDEYGPNELAEVKGPSALHIFVRQFKNFLIAILIFATVFSALVGEIVDAVVILAILVASALLGFIQEYRAERSMEALKKFVAPKAHVLRDGGVKEVPSRELVPGDILVLRTGDRIQADGRVIESINMKTDEAPLTGESTPIEKKAEIVLDEETPIADRRNMVLMGTTVTYGRGRALVVATGMNTEFGKIAEMIQTIEEEETPLQKRIGHVGKWLGISILVVSALAALTGFIRGMSMLEMIIGGISLAVAAVPEALPAVVTIGLAFAVRRMLKRNAIVRKMSSVETLGSATVICADKTGTLTRGEMSVSRLYVDGRLVEVTGVGYEPRGDFIHLKNPEGVHGDVELLLTIGALCNDASLVKREGRWMVDGDPTEGALIVAATKGGVRKEELDREYPRVGEIPFSSERKRMTTIHKRPDGTKVAYAKGAPEIVIELCSRIMVNKKVRRMTTEDKLSILDMNKKMAGEGLRVLAMAYKDLPASARSFTEGSVERDLVFVGMEAMIDLPREEAKTAVEKCKRAGIRVVMITGDHKLTALNIATRLGIKGEALTGSDLDKISDEQLSRVLDEVSVYARVSPQHKLKILNAFKEKGHIVAMTGDGVNDAPALKTSDIGVAMGITGTDVAKEASEVVLADDNFNSIVSATEEGRMAYDNIRKFIMYLLSCNVGEICIIFFATLLGFPWPLLATQILWINLTTDGLPAIALSADPPEPDVMSRPPRPPKESIFSSRMKAIIIGVGLFTAIFIIPIFGWVYGTGDAASLQKARTMAFTLMVMFEMFNVFNCRSERESIFKVGFLTNRYMMPAIASSILLQLAVIYLPPLQVAFQTVPLGLYDWLLILAVSSTVLIPVEIGKALSHQRQSA